MTGEIFFRQDPPTNSCREVKQQVLMYEKPFTKVYPLVCVFQPKPLITRDKLAIAIKWRLNVNYKWSINQIIMVIQ